LGKYSGNERLVIHVAAARKLLGKRDKCFRCLLESLSTDVFEP